MVILEFDFKSLNDKIVNSYLPQMLKESQNVRGKGFRTVAIFERILERERAQGARALVVGARHACAERCDTAGSPATRPAGAHDTEACVLTIRPWRPTTRAGQGAQTSGFGCDTAGGLGHDTARPAHDTARRALAWASQSAPGRARRAC